MVRKTSKGRRKVEESEFCRNCNRLAHDEEIIRLTAKVAELERFVSSSLMRANSITEHAKLLWRNAKDVLETK